MAQAKTKHPIQIGADPEVFLFDNKNKQIIPSCGLIGGDKGKGVAFGDVVDYKWLEDNVAVEFNFPPSRSPNNFITIIKDVMATADVAVKKKLGPHFSLEVVPEANFDFHKLINIPKAMEIGCDPDLLAYDYPPMPRSPLQAVNLGGTRFAGGHLHLSFDNKDNIPGYAIAMMADAFIALPAIRADRQRGRRAHYGLAGLYREKPYGIEYRTMSNWWCGVRNTSIRANVITNAYWLLACLNNAPKEVSDVFALLPWQDIRNAINTENFEEGARIYTLVRDIAGNGSLGNEQGFAPV